MIVLHLCLGYPIHHNGGYQDNIITREQVKQGHKVYLMANWIRNFDGTQIRESYVSDGGVNVIYLHIKKNAGYFAKFGLIEKLYENIETIAPDIIFVHSGQFVSMNQVVKYCKRHLNVRLYIDNHSDYYNTPVNTLKSSILHRIIFAYALRRAYKYTTKYWGVTPWRCQYLHEVYHIPKDKIDLLVMGGEDECIHFERQTAISTAIRNHLSIQADNFVIVTGGKIDCAKNIHLLMRTITEINDSNIKLIVFGKVVDDIRDEIERLGEHSSIRYIGWIESSKVYDYFLSSDLAVFPGTHSVLWEQACACGIPIVVKRWPGMEHVNLGGNCEFLDEVSVESMKAVILKLYKNRYTSLYMSMKQIAVDRGIPYFSYRRIAKKSIGME